MRFFSFDSLKATPMSKFLCTSTMLIAALFLNSTAFAQSALEYQLILENPNAHFLRVNLTVPVSAKSSDFSLPAWAPGSYQIVNYAKYVQDFSARDEANRSLPFEKIDKQTWRVNASPESKRSTISYRVFANILSDTESEFNEAHAQIFGPQVFMYAVNRKTSPVRLSVTPLRGWRIATGLEALNDSTFRADDYDSFIDAPLEIGNFNEEQFKHDGISFRLAVHGETDTSRIRDFARQLKQIVAEQMQMMGKAPFQQYVFMWHVDARAEYYGLEHLNSTSIGMPHRLGDLSSADDVSPTYAGLTRQDIDLEYAAHEFFHLWNVKRIRPVTLGPFDYTREVYTTGLWIAEGWSDYYGYLTLRRTGQWPEWKWLRLYANLLAEYRKHSGWKFRSARQASFDTWLWSYGSGEQGNLGQTFFSYYPHGNLLALCMDLRIRSKSKNQRSLDDVMRALQQRFGLPKPGFTEAQFWQCVSEATQLDWKDFRRQFVEGTQPLPVEQFLALAGIAVDTLSNAHTPYLGISAKNQNNQAVIAEVAYASPAAQAGLEADDRLLACDDEALTFDNWQEVLQAKPVGTKINLLIARRGRIRKLEATLAAQPATSFEFSISETATAEANTLRARWWQPYAGQEAK